MRLVAFIKLWPLCLLCTRAAAEAKVRLHVLHENEPNLKEYLQEVLTFDIASKLARIYSSVDLSFSTFTDKPLPFIGYGNYGNFQSYSYLDYCHKVHVPLSSNLVAAKDIALESISLTAPPPLSAPSAVFDALLRLLTNLKIKAVGANSVADTNLRGNTTTLLETDRLLDVVVIITSTWSHEPGDAQAGIDKWNSKRLYPKEQDDFSWGGFGSDLFDGVALRDTKDIEDWNRLAHAFRDADMKGVNPQIPAHLLEKFGPFPYPAIDPTHIGECDKTEYPAWEVIREQLKLYKDLFVVFAIAEPAKSTALERKCASTNTSTGLPCLLYLYQQYITRLDIQGSVVALESPKNLSHTVVDTITRLITKKGSIDHTTYGDNVHHHNTSKSAVTASLAAASGALVTSFIGGLLVWQKCVDDEDLFEEESSPVQMKSESRPPLSRAEKAELMFQGLPIDEFSSFEPLESTPRTVESNLPEHFF